MATRAQPKAPVLTLNKILKSKSAGAVQGDVEYKDLEKKNAEQDKVMGKLQEDFNEHNKLIMKMQEEIDGLQSKIGRDVKDEPDDTHVQTPVSSNLDNSQERGTGGFAFREWKMSTDSKSLPDKKLDCQYENAKALGVDSGKLEKLKSDLNEVQNLNHQCTVWGDGTNEENKDKTYYSFDGVELAPKASPEARFPCLPDDENGCTLCHEDKAKCPKICTAVNGIVCKLKPHTNENFGYNT